MIASLACLDPWLDICHSQSGKLGVFVVGYVLDLLVGYMPQSIRRDQCFVNFFICLFICFWDIPGYLGPLVGYMPHSIRQVQLVMIGMVVSWLLVNFTKALLYVCASLVGSVAISELC